MTEVDNIIVMKKGEVVESGTHKVLMKKEANIIIYIVRNLRIS
jgi:ABC-type multidrug transport system fused ATPase/permease subunit